MSWQVCLPGCLLMVLVVPPGEVMPKGSAAGPRRVSMRVTVAISRTNRRWISGRPSSKGRVTAKPRSCRPVSSSSRCTCHCAGCSALIVLADRGRGLAASFSHSQLLMVPAWLGRGAQTSSSGNTVALASAGSMARPTPSAGTNECGLPCVIARKKRCRCMIAEW